MNKFENEPNAVILTSMAPINLYNDLFWRGMSLVPTFGTATAAGLVPDTGVNMAGFNAYTDYSTLLQGAPAMTVDYDDSEIKDFELYSFAYGCATNTITTVGGLVLSCTITATGYNKHAVQIQQESFEYISDGQLQQKMQTAVVGKVKGWKGLHTVAFTVSNAINTQGYIDTVVYKVNEK